MEFEKKDALIGAFVLAALAVFVFSLAAVNRERVTAQTYPIEIRLPNISGIDKGVEVMYQGYKAGAVERITITYEPEFRFNVRLAIKNEIRLRQGTTVLVRNKGFGGTKFLELATPAEAGGALLKEGSVLAAVRETDVMVKANEVLGEVQKVVANFQKRGTAEDLVQVVKNARTALGSLDRALNGMNALMDENRAALKAAVQDAQGITARANDLLAKKDAALQQTLDDLRQTTSHLPSIMVNVEELTADLKRRPWRLVRKGTEGPPLQLDHKHVPTKP